MYYYYYYFQVGNGDQALAIKKFWHSYIIKKFPTGPLTMARTPFPYHPPLPRNHELKPVKLEEEGTDGKVSKHAWLTDGAVRPIESGLPRHPYDAASVAKSQSSLMHLLVDRPYVKEFNRTYGALAVRHPEYDLADPDMMSHYEKQLVAQHSADTAVLRATELKCKVPGTQQKTTKIPLDAHLHTWGGTIPYFESDIFPEDDIAVNEVKVPRERRVTGVEGDVNTRAPDMSGVIRPIRFRTLSQEEASDPSLSRDEATVPLVFAPGGKRFASSVTDLSSGIKDDTCQRCLKRFFDPKVGIPFIPPDVGKYFPLELLLPEELAKAAKGDALASSTSEESEPPSMLLVTDDQDVLFTKNKAPFTRADISTVRAFERHWDELKVRQRDRAEKALVQRRRYVHQAFHSDSVFRTYLDLLNEDCHRIRSGVIGKSPYKGKSLWQVAAARAPNDHSSLEERRKFWWRFCAFVRYVGGVSEELEKAYVRDVRVKLMMRHPINPQLFWDLANDLPVAAFESVPALRLIEFVRIALSVGQGDFGLFLDDKQVSRMIYNQTVLSNTSREFLDRVNTIATGPVSVPPTED
jgi:hypothetical protein